MAKDKKLAYGFMVACFVVLLAGLLSGCGAIRDGLYVLEYHNKRDSSGDLYKLVPKE